MTMHVDHVVVGYDFSRSAHAALDRAVALAAHTPHQVLHVLCVIDPRTPVPAIPAYDGVDHMYAARVQEALAAAMHDVLDAAEVTSPVHFFVHARIGGHAADEICTLAREVGAQLVIVGSHSLVGLERLLVGSVAEKVVRDAGCTVEVARPRTYEDVDLTPILDVETHDQTYVPPHRYTYEDRRVNLRPPEWPLY